MPTLCPIRLSILNRNIDITIEESDELAEQIIKIVRDYHLVEDK